MVDFVARATALQPLVREHADQADAERRLPKTVALAFVREGLMRMAAPPALGGANADPATQVRTIETISEADGSAGWNLMIGIETFGLVAPAFASCPVLISDPDTIIASSTAAVGTAEPTAGGFIVTGRWQFVSGCHSCDVFAGLVRTEPNEPPRYAAMPRSEVEILDTWHVSGMRGSGSHDVEASRVFIPTEQLLMGAIGSGRGDTPLERIPLNTRLAYNKVGVAFGIARAALDSFVDLATNKMPRFSAGSLRDRPFAQRAIADAEIRFRGARALVFEQLDSLWETVSAGERFEARDRAIFQLACSGGVAACVEAVERVVEAAGTSANAISCPLERQARDVRVVRQHFTVAPHHIEDAGRVLLGLDPQYAMLAGRP
jgi:alkylation response protein AidB-like acyl-CoA dehydrogenase